MFGGHTYSFLSGRYPGLELWAQEVSKCLALTIWFCCCTSFVAVSIQHDSILCCVNWSFNHSRIFLSLVNFFILKSTLSYIKYNISQPGQKKKIYLSLVTVIREMHSHTLWRRYRITYHLRCQFCSIYWKMYIHAHWPCDLNYRNLSLKKIITHVQKTAEHARMLIAALFITVKNRNNLNCHQ